MAVVLSANQGQCGHTPYIGLRPGSALTSVAAGKDTPVGQSEEAETMAYVDWLLRGRKIGTCSCDYGCPCEFLGRPTNPPCEGLEAMEIDEGYFGSVRLDGLRFAGSFRWPGAVHAGHGEFQPVMDKRATDEQLEA